MTPQSTAPPESGDEQALVARLRGGDEAAFETLVRTHTGMLLAVARRFLKNEEDAREAVQSAFTAAFSSLVSFQGGSRLATWLHRIVINTALMRLRSQRRKPEEAIDDLLPRFSEDGVLVGPVREWTGSPERLLMQQETRRWVRTTIEQLPPGYRGVILLRDIEEMSTEETARLLDITPNAVKIRLHRARLALRTLLDVSLAERAS